MSNVNNDSSCQVHFVPLETNCDHGSCVNNTCVCVADYTNIGDFSLNSQGACDIYEPIIVAEWACVLASVIFSLGWCAWAIHKRFKQGKVFDRGTWRVGIVPFGQLFSCLIAFIIGVLKLVPGYPNSNIGQDVLVTVLSLLFVQSITLTLFCGYLVFMKISVVLLPISTEQRSILRQHSKSLEYISLVCIVLGSLMTWSPLMMLFRPDLLQIAAYVLAIGCSSMFLLVGVGSGTIFATRMIHSMREAISTKATKDLQLLLIKLRVGRVFMLVGFVCSAVTVLAFGFTPFLTKKASYIYPILFIVGLLAVDIQLWIINNSSSTGKAANREQGATLQAPNANQQITVVWDAKRKQTLEPISPGPNLLTSETVRRTSTVDV